MPKHALALVLVAAAVPAAAQAPSPAAPPQSARPAKPNPLDKIVCKTEETMGTRLGAHRVCATVREWQDQAQENRDATEKIQQGQGTVPST